MLKPNVKTKERKRRVKEKELKVDDWFADVVIIDDEEPEPPPGGAALRPPAGR